LERVLVSLLRAFPASWRQFPRAVGAQLGDKIWIVDQLAERLGVARNKIRVGDHHRSHAASAFYCSPYPEAAVLTVDGVGEETSTAIWDGDGAGLRLVERLAFPHSLGLFYAALTAWLGFEVNEGEYKVMGLAAFGYPRFADEMARLVRVASDGSFELGLEFFAHTHDSELGFSPRLEQLLGPRRAPGRRWDLDGDEDRRYADVAASAQAATERALLALARRARERTGRDALCLAGGVALNAVANARLAAESGFARVFVQPAAGDAGAALGAAILISQQFGDPRPAALASAALGDEADPAEALALAGDLGLAARRVGDPAGEAAARLARGEVVAWVQGRFEWGPRALGQRSILAAPTDAGVRERLNRAVKQREPFRPFAPAVLAGDCERFFDGAPDDLTPFMTTVRRVRDGARLDAVRHVDGTARVQTVPPDGALAPLLARLDTPVVLNTSLNGPGEPICAGAVDAIAFFARHPVDALIVGDVLVQR
jgi:carbamoyltransferase